MAGEITWWIDPYGNQTQLDVDWSATGRFMPAVAHQELGTPGQPGSYVYQSLHQPHEFTLPCWFYGTTDIDLRTQLRTIVASMSPDRGTGRIRVQSPLGDQREIWCRYSDGLGLDESEGNAGITTQKAAVLFRAFDPYWYDVSPANQTWGITNVPTFFPIFPLRLTSSSVVVQSTVVNSGDVPTFPIWTITGPGSSIQLVNNTTGEFLSLPSLTLGSGEVLTIDTRFGHTSVTKQDGSNQFSQLHVASTLWAMTVGSNAFQLQMSGATAGVSSIAASYYQRYLSP